MLSKYKIKMIGEIMCFTISKGQMASTLYMKTSCGIRCLTSHRLQLDYANLLRY